MNTTVAALIIKTLAAAGVKRIYGVPGDSLNGLTEAGIEVVGRKPLHAPINVHNRRYMTAKAMRAGHELDHLMVALADAGEPQLARTAEEVR